MATDIKAGDLVVIVHTHCAATERLIGGIDTVSAIESCFLICTLCNKHFGVYRAALLPNARSWCPLAWLRRIEPLSAEDHIEHEEEVHG